MPDLFEGKSWLMHPLAKLECRFLRQGEENGGEKDVTQENVTGQKVC